MTTSAMTIEDVVPDEWYHPDVTNPKFGIRPIDLELDRAIHRAMLGYPPPVRLPLRTTAENGLAESPWLSAYGCPMFNAEARAAIDDVAWPGEVRWLPLVIQTPKGLVDDYHIAAPALDGGDFVSERHTTRDPRGKPIRWVLDRTKLGDRQVLMFPGVSVGGLIMRGRLLQRLVELGSQGVVIRRARVVPSC